MTAVAPSLPTGCWCPAGGLAGILSAEWMPRHLEVDLAVVPKAKGPQGEGLSQALGAKLIESARFFQAVRADSSLL